MTRAMHRMKLNVEVILLCLLICLSTISLYNVYHIRDPPNALIRELAEALIRNVSPSAWSHPSLPCEDTQTEGTTFARQLKEILRCNDHPLVREYLQYGDYWAVRNFVRGTASKSAGCADTLTYTTIGDFTFFSHLAPLVSRWLAPISFAVFAPGHDMNSTMDSIQYVRNCLPESELIRKFVSFHVYFPSQHMPAYVPHSEEEALQWDPRYLNCDVREAPYSEVDRESLYKTKVNLTYPINVGRNIARKAANTYFILSSDIELMPSEGLADQFLQMVTANESIVLTPRSLRVFPLPVFELQDDTPIPATKAELEGLLKKRLAVPFHWKVCKACHLVPDQSEWLKKNGEGVGLSVFTVGKRQEAFKHWEPFYISDNREPMFDERVTWEGQSNKRIQNFAMCLLDYEYHVLHPGFLVHTPGIKHYNRKDPRYLYVPSMNRLIKKVIEPEYRILYGQNPKCTT